MKVLMLNGSCNPKGCTYTALTEVGKTLTSAGIDYEIVQLGGDPVRDCIGCNQCSKNGCVFTDGGVNDFIAKARQADGFVFGTPVYYAHPSGRVLSFLDRVFYAGGSAFAGKPGAAVASARRAGTTASLDALGKYFGISDMVTVGSTYWNMVHGHCPEDVMLDGEGLQTMRNLGRSMAWLLHCIQAGRVRLPCPGAWSSDELHPLKDAAKRSGRRYAPAAPFYGRIFYCSASSSCSSSEGAPSSGTLAMTVRYTRRKNSIVTPSEAISAMG